MQVPLERLFLIIKVSLLMEHPHLTHCLCISPTWCLSLLSMLIRASSILHQSHIGIFVAWFYLCLVWDLITICLPMLLFSVSHFVQFVNFRFVSRAPEKCWPRPQRGGPKPIEEGPNRLRRNDWGVQSTPNEVQIVLKKALYRVCYRTNHAQTGMHPRRRQTRRTWYPIIESYWSSGHIITSVTDGTSVPFGVEHSRIPFVL